MTDLFLFTVEAYDLRDPYYDDDFFGITNDDRHIHSMEVTVKAANEKEALSKAYELTARNYGRILSVMDADAPKYRFLVDVWNGTQKWWSGKKVPDPRTEEMQLQVEAFTGREAGNKACRLTGRGWYEIVKVEDAL